MCQHRARSPFQVYTSEMSTLHAIFDIELAEMSLLGYEVQS